MHTVFLVFWLFLCLLAVIGFLKQVAVLVFQTLDLYLIRRQPNRLAAYWGLGLQETSQLVSAYTPTQRFIKYWYFKLETMAF